MVIIHSHVRVRAIEFNFKYNLHNCPCLDSPYQQVMVLCKVSFNILNHFRKLDSFQYVRCFLFHQDQVCKIIIYILSNHKFVMRNTTKQYYTKRQHVTSFISMASGKRPEHLAPPEIVRIPYYICLRIL